MRTLEWTVPEVELALLGLKKITVPEFEILASFEVPPKVVLLVMEAVQTLLGAEDVTWESARADLLQEKSSSLDASVEFSKMLATSPGNKFAKEYPKPTKPKKHAILVKKILSYCGDGKDPKTVTESIRKYVTHPEFTPENAALSSRAARALCVWVQAIEMNFQEQRKKPPRNQIEQAIKKGQSSAAGVFNMQVTRLLPMISKATGKKLDSKEYDDLQASKNYIMRRIFKDKHKEARKAISSNSEETTSAPDTYERDVDLRASHEAFRKNLELRIQSRDLRKRAEPRLVSLCKFNDRAFQPEAAGLRSWERFHNIDPQNVCFQDAAPRPCTVERKVRRSEDLNRLYKSDILIKQLLKALDSSAPEEDTIRKLVSAGANLDYVDEKGNTVYDIIRDKKLFVSLHVLDRIVQEKRNTAFVPTESPEKLKKRTQPIHLPVIELPRPASFQQQHRSPMVVKTYRKEVAPEWEPKFHLTDPNEVLSDSDVEEEEEEEVIDPVVRKKENILRYGDLFIPPLTPPNAATLDQTPMELPEPVEEPASPSLAGVEEEASVEAASEEGVPEDPSFFLTDGTRLSLMTPEDGLEEMHSSASSQQDLAASHPGSQSVSEAGSPLRRTGAASMLEEFEKLQRESVAKKKILFDIYKGSTDRGGIDDPAANSSAHEYLRLCEQLGLLPRPLAFGRPNQKDLNLQGFGLYPRHAQALALSISGLEACTSLNLQENKLGDEGLASLCKALINNTTIVSLNLSFNGIRTSSQHISDLLAENETLKHINLQGNHFPDKHLAKIVTSVCEPDVRDSLSIAGNAAGKHTTPLLVKLVETCKIRTLDLCWMGLGKKFAEALSLVLDKNQHLKVLKLAWNGICDESVTMLARCFAEAASVGKMKLEVLDLANNRIRERGAATLALTIERYGAKLPLQSITLDGNAIGDIGVRACISSMAVCNVAWGLWNCSPEVRPSEEQKLFEGDRLWRQYELDLSDPYEHLVAWKVGKLSLPSSTTPEGQTWVDAKIDGASIEQADADWDPPESGTLEMSIKGPIRELECKKVFASESLSILVPLEEEGLPDLLEGSVETRHSSAASEDEEAKGKSEKWRVVKYAKQDLFTAGYDYVRQLSDPVGGVNQFIAERLSPNIKPGALLYVDRSRIEVTQVRPSKQEFSVTGISATLQTALTEGHRQELEFRHSFLILAPVASTEPASEPAEAEPATPEGEEPPPPPPPDDGLRSCLYEARLPRAPVEGVHFERIMQILAGFSRTVGEEGAVLFLRTMSKELCFSVRQVEKIAEAFLFVPAKRLLPLLLSPSDATASLRKLNQKTKNVTTLGEEFKSISRPWVDRDTAIALDKHLVHQQTAIWKHRTDAEEFADMVGGKFEAVRRGPAIAPDPDAGMERSVTFKLVGDGGSEWDEPMGALSKVVLVLADKRLVLPVLDHDVHRQTLRLGDAPLSVSMAIELGEMANVGTFKVSALTKEDEAYEFEYAEFMATSPGQTANTKSSRLSNSRDGFPQRTPSAGR